MTTVAELIEAVYDHLLQEHRPTLTTLAVAALSGDTAMTVDNTTNLGPGTFIAIDDELVYVSDVNSSNGVCQVIRGQRGTTAAAHALAAVVEINPRFARYRVRRALQEEIRSFPNDLFGTLSVDLDTSTDAAGYDLVGVPSTYLHILDVQLGPRTQSLNDAVVRPNYYEVRGADATIYASGAGIVLTGAAGSIRDLRVTVAVPFVTSTFTDATTLATIGLTATMEDIPPLGAASRLMVGREVKRTFGEGQPESRRAEEVPVGSSSGTATYLRRETTRRINEECIRLRAQWPMRRL